MDYCQPRFYPVTACFYLRGINRERRHGLHANDGYSHLRSQPGLLAELSAGPLRGNTRVVKGWLAQLPHKYHQRGLHVRQAWPAGPAGGAFLAFVRTLLPTMAGISGLSNRRFQFFNWLSALLWVGVVTTLGYALNMIPFVKHHEDQVMTFLMVLPMFLLVAGLVGTIAVVIKKKYCSA